MTANTTAGRKSERRQPATWISAIAIALGGYALPCLHASQIVAWGAGKATDAPDFYSAGQSVVPANLTNAVLLVGGWRHSLALKTDRTLQAWGDDSAGQSDFFPAGQSNYVAIGCGQLHSVALNSNGIPVTAGDNLFSQQEIPTNLSNVVAVAAGFYHSLALRKDGTVIAWGMSTNASAIGVDPNYGQTSIPADLSNVVSIAAGGWHSLALRDNGTLRAWGRDSNGQAEIPVGISNVIAISAGASHNLILTSDGRVTAWGYNFYGQTNVPPDLSNVVAIAAGGWHNLALKNDGTVVAWGAGSAGPTLVYGQNSVPPGLSNVVQIAAGLAHSLALIDSAPPLTRSSLVHPSMTSAGFGVSVITRFGHVYRIESAGSPASTTWNALPLQFGLDGELRLIDPAPTGPQRFYRARKW